MSENSTTIKKYDHKFNYELLAEVQQEATALAEKLSVIKDFERTIGMTAIHEAFDYAAQEMKKTIAQIPPNHQESAHAVLMHVLNRAVKNFTEKIEKETSDKSDFAKRDDYHHISMILTTIYMAERLVIDTGYF